MKFLALIAAALSAIAAQAQTIVKIDLAKDNGRGKPGVVTKGFATTDNPIHCLIRMKPLKATVFFSGSLVAVEAGRVKNYRVVSTDLSGTPGMETMDFKFSLPKSWPAGSYKIDLKTNGKPLKTLTFDIK